MLSGFCFVIDVHRIIGCSSSGKAFIRDQSRVADASHIYSELIEIILTPSFARLLGNSVNSARFHDGILRCLVSWSSGPENRNR
ncbi:hypothetical protein D3C86_1678780 [compost metagenome]